MFWEENSCLFQGWVLKGMSHKLQPCSCMQASVCGKSLQLCPILCDPVGCSSPGSFVHGILHAHQVPMSMEFSMQVGSCCAFLHGVFPIWIEPVTSVSCIGRLVLYHLLAGAKIARWK